MLLALENHWSVMAKLKKYLVFSQGGELNMSLMCHGKKKYTNTLMTLGCLPLNVFVLSGV